MFKLYDRVKVIDTYNHRSHENAPEYQGLEGIIVSFNTDPTYNPIIVEFIAVFINKHNHFGPNRAAFEPYMLTKIVDKGADLFVESIKNLERVKEFA